MNKIFTTLLLLVLLIGAALVSRDSIYAQAVPAQVTGVQVEFPNCVNDVCNFTEASCSWNATSGATQYRYVITRVETNTQAATSTVDASTLKVSFPVVANQTYKCDVFAINASGESASAGSHELFCAVDAMVDDPTPTPIPTTPPSTPMPTIPPTGGLGTTLPMAGAAVALLSGIGAIFFLRR